MSGQRPVEIHVARDIAVPMRDGTVLYADLYRPKDLGPCPVLLMRTPYGKTQALTSINAHPSWYARHGYIVVVQDVRGRWSSQGEWYPFAHETLDGYDSVEWAARIPGSSGRVGMYGLSYGGATQLLAAIGAPPHLACIVPAMTASEYYEGWTYRGGALQQAFVQLWALHLAKDVARRRGLKRLEADLTIGVLDLPRLWSFLPLEGFELLRRENIAPWFFDWLAHPCRDEYWERWDIERRHSMITVPALHVAGWYDIFLDGTLRNFSGLRSNAANTRARQGQRLIVGPWHHSSWAPVVSGWNFGDEARNRINEIQLRWFDYWLKGEPTAPADEPPLQVFVMGENRWRSASEWPPEDTETLEFYLHSGGTANSTNGDGSLSLECPGTELPDSFVYDPASPVPSVGGRSCWRHQVEPMGPAEQWPVEVLNSVLVYTTAPLDRNVEVIGPVSTVLFAATTARDTDWTVKLVDVRPDGRSVNVTDGIIRGRYRNSLSRPEILGPGEVYEYRIELGATAMLFSAGHRIRLQVSSSSFPCYDRNLNTGGQFGSEWISDRVVATQTVFHDFTRPSRLVLSVIRG